MRPDSIQAVLLDMGGILIPEVPGYAGATRDLALLAKLQSSGIREPAEFVRDCAQRVRQSYRDLEKACTQPDLERVLADVPPGVRRLLLDAFRAQATQPAFAHARDVVVLLARRYRLGLVSNTAIPGDHHRRALARAGIMEHIEYGVWSANFGRRKPDPAMLLHVLGKLGLPARHAILVGDKLHTDILAANRAGLRSVYVRKPGAPHLGGEARPDFCIQHLGALPELLARLG